MRSIDGFNLVPPQSLFTLETTLHALPSSQRLTLFERTISCLDAQKQDLGFERKILSEAIKHPESEDHLKQALSLYERPGRLFYALAPQAKQLREDLGLSSLPDSLSSFEERPEDVLAQNHWHRLSLLEAGGAAMMTDRVAFYDPVGAFSGGIIHFLDRQGRRAHQEMRTEKVDDWMPTLSFGVLGRDESNRRSRYNEGHFGEDIGDVKFDFPQELQMLMVPPVYADLLRKIAGFQITIPSADFLEERVTVEWARNLPQNARIMTGIKGLVSGLTPLEYIEDILKEAGREDVVVIDFLGFASSAKLIREQREFQQGLRKKLDTVEIVLACKRGTVAVDVAMNFAGLGATVKSEKYEGIAVPVVENLDLPRPVRFIILDDPEVIRANEKASIDKNNQALTRGRHLCQTMVDSAQNGIVPPPVDNQELYGKLMEEYVQLMQSMDSESADKEEKKNARIAQIETDLEIPPLYREMMIKYRGEMRQAKADIIEALIVEQIPASKAVLLPGVIKDLYGSWTTGDFEPLYKLIHQIFNPRATEEEWQEGMIRLRLLIGKYYAVRNPRYGFCLEADRLARKCEDRFLSLQGARVVAERMRRQGLITEEAFRKLELEGHNGVHFTFSMIPKGLHPEGLQIVEQQPIRCKNKKINVEKYPESYREAYLFVQRLQRSLLFDETVAQRVVDISQTLGLVFPENENSEPGKYISFLKEILGCFEKGYEILLANRQVLRGGQNAQAVLKLLIMHFRKLIMGIESHEGIGREEISYLNQGVMEVLTSLHRYYFLNPDESRKEARSLIKRLRRLNRYEETLDVDDLFPMALQKGEGGEASWIRLVVQEREKIFKVIGKDLIELTHAMSFQVNSVDKAVTRKDVMDALRGIQAILEKTIDELSLSSSGEAVQLGMMTQFIRLIQQAVPKRLTPQASLLIYQSLIETLIYTRHLLVLPEGRAIAAAHDMVDGFQHILGYVRSSLEFPSPLREFTNGHSTHH